MAGAAWASIAHDFLHLGEEHCGMNGLGKKLELVILGAGCVDEMMGRCLPGEEEHLTGRLHFAQLDGSFNSRDARQDDIGDHQIRLEVARHLKRHLAAIGCARIVPGHGKDRGEGVGNDSLVVNDKHPRVMVVRAGCHIPSA